MTTRMLSGDDAMVVVGLVWSLVGCGGCLCVPPYTVY